MARPRTFQKLTEQLFQNWQIAFQRVDGGIAPTKKFFARLLLGPACADLPQQVSKEAPELTTFDDYLIDEPNLEYFALSSPQ